MSLRLILDDAPLKLSDVEAFAFARGPVEIEITEATCARVRRAHGQLLSLLKKGTPIYGVTTGFGDSCHRVISTGQSEELQRNLIAYLSCGTGEAIPEAATRASFLIRLKSLSLGFSGVSVELLERMKLFLERGWAPIVPREGSLGASGDLIPLAYLAAALQGEGELHSPKGPVRAADVLAQAGVAPYRLKPKEGLALVNGTSSMAGLCVLNLARARELRRLATVSSAWLCLALRGRTEAFGHLVNDRAKAHAGQSRVAAEIRALLESEGYRPGRGQDIAVHGHATEGFVQDRYSLRCAPQVIGPVFETIEQASTWVEQEVNSASDNPLIGDDGELEMGGNFYGGYLAHGMDYLKISLANLADLIDRQLTLLIDEKSNRGLTPNLADWRDLNEGERHLHHGLKGLHQSVSAITSGIMAKATPNSIFSRSSESHNQDKVSLGMTAAVQCLEMTDALFTTQAMHLACLAQALDLREIDLRGDESRALYSRIRDSIPFVRRDRALGPAIRALASNLSTGAAGSGSAIR